MAHTDGSTADVVEPVVYAGGCHCRRVRWEFIGTRKLTAWRCNCSICRMKQNWHVIVPGEAFTLLSGGDTLTTYTFETGVAKHKFCSVCGVQSFYNPRSNPGGVAVTLFCIDEDRVGEYEIRDFDGKHWEESYNASKIALLTARPEHPSS